MNKKLQAAYILGRESHLLEFFGCLVPEPCPDEMAEECFRSLENGLEDLIVILADDIKPGVLVELHHVLDDIRRKSAKNLKLFEQQGPEFVTKAVTRRVPIPETEGFGQKLVGFRLSPDPLEVPGPVYSSRLRSLVSRAFTADSKLAPWCHLGAAVGEFIGMATRTVSIEAAKDLLNRMARSASLVENAERHSIPEIEFLAQFDPGLDDRELIPFLEGVLARRWKRQQEDMSQDFVNWTLAEGIGELDATILQAFKRDATSDEVQESREGARRDEDREEARSKTESGKPEGSLPVQTLAQMYGVSGEALRKRLERWRNDHTDGWEEVLDRRGARKPRYKYFESAIRDVLLALQKKQRRKN